MSILARKRPAEQSSSKIIRKRVATLKPSPENGALYRADDPDIGALADSIRKNGLFEMLTITSDRYVVSGHRRLAALKLIGQKFVKCRVLPIRHDDLTRTQYIALLREHNRQRNKTVAEQVREEIVDIDPELAVANLHARRHASVYADRRHGIQSLTLGAVKGRAAIGATKAEHVEKIIRVVNDLYDYWPLSIRGVHYGLLNFVFLRNTKTGLLYANDRKSYASTANLITRLRLNGTLPWGAFDDPTRPFKDFHAFADVRQFVRDEVERCCVGYWRDLLQSQPNHVELVCEKNTVFHIAQRVTKKYQIPTSSGRGFNSIDPWHDLAERYRDSGKERSIVIVLSDYDPEGERIPYVGGRTLRDDFDIDNVQIIKAGVTREQIERYALPKQNFAKEKSKNYKWFVDRNDGDDAAYELEAIAPEQLLNDLDATIRGVIDVELFNREIERENEEANYLEVARIKVAEALKGLGE